MLGFDFLGYVLGSAEGVLMCFVHFNQYKVTTLGVMRNVAGSIRR